MATKKPLSTANKNVVDMSQEELAHEQARIEVGSVQLRTEVGNLNNVIANLNAQLAGLATAPGLNSLQRFFRRHELNRQLTDTTFERDARRNTLARYAGRSFDIASRMMPYGTGILNRIRADMRIGKPTSVDLTTPFVAPEDQRGLQRSSSRVMMDYFRSGVTFFREQRPIQKFTRAAFRRGGGFNLMGGLGALKGIPVLGQISTAITGAYQVFKQLDHFAGYQRKMLSDAQAGYNATLLSGLDFETATGLGKTIAIKGGSAGEGVQLAGGIARGLGGVRYGQLPQQLMNAAMRFGLKIHGSGYGGMATTEEILTNMADLMKDANSMDKEQLAYMASQMGLSAATVRAMEGGADSFKASIHVFDGLVQQFGESELIQMADNAKFAKELREQSMAKLRMNLFGGDFGTGWDTFASNITNMLNLAFGGDIEERKATLLKRDELKVLIGDYNKRYKAGDFESEEERLALRNRILHHEGNSQYFNANTMLMDPERDKWVAEEIVKKGLIFRSFKNAKERADTLARTGSFTESSFSTGVGTFGTYVLKKNSELSELNAEDKSILNTKAEYVADENGVRIVSVDTSGRSGGGITINGNILLETNPETMEKIAQDAADKAVRQTGEITQDQQSQAVKDSDNGYK